MSARQDEIRSRGTRRDETNQQFSWLIYNFNSYLFFKLNIESIFKKYLITEQEYFPNQNFSLLFSTIQKYISIQIYL
jgi:hypothetical protein